MKALLGASALAVAMVVVGASPAAATDINIYVQGEDGAKVGHGRHGMDGAPHMRGHGRHHGYHHGMMHGDDRSRGRHGYAHHGDGHDGDRDKRRARGGDRHGDAMGHGRRMEHMLDLIELYDQDGDGKVTQMEIDRARANRLASFDRDGSGTLSLEEYEALWLDAMRERMVDRFQAHDDDGDGQVTVEEFSERTGRMVLRGDRNGDGAISAEDLRRGDGGRRMMPEDRQHMMRQGGQQMMREGGRQMMRDRDTEE